MIQHKTFELDEFSTDENGIFEGYASTFNNVDSGGDVVMPGAFTKAIKDFLHDGFFSWGHDWNMPVAMPLAAHEDMKGLFVRGQFHSTQAAQDARTISLERAAKGLRMGLSIGYGVEDSAPGPNKTTQLKTIYPLFETALVMVPMNREANQTAVKGLADATSLSESVGRITASLPDIVARFEVMQELRQKDGRVLSSANHQLLRDLLSALTDASGPLQDLLDATDPDMKGLIAIARERARFLGVPV